METRLWAALAAVAVLLAAVPARAEDPTRRRFDPDTARLALSIDGGFVSETAATAPKGYLGAGLVLDYASGLLALELGSRRDQLLERRLSLNLLAAYSLGRVELAVDVPVALYQRADFSLLTDAGVQGPLVAPVARSALGDVRLGAKVPVLDEARAPVGLAALLDLRLPTGDGRAFYSDGLAAVPSVIATRHLGPVRLDGQLGYLFRRQGQYAQLVAHDAAVYTLGVSGPLPRLGKLAVWRAIGEVTGQWPRAWTLASERYRAPLSARAGVRWWVWRDLAVEGGAGAGIGTDLGGYGHELWRAFVGVRWTPRPPARPGDRDGDGIPDAEDRCPDQPGPAALHGCPDRDGDGIPDAEDRCPDQPGPAALDGCPDRDGDEIPDADDKCPDQPGPAQNDGCPVAADEPLVEIETERLSLKDAIHFDTAKDTIKPESFKILDEIAKLLNAHSELTKVRVEGHTDNVGSAPYNKDLSQRRASSVVRYLAERGHVARARLEAVGFGFERPVATNATAIGRAKNRRVEFNIVGEK
jgi:outer membrane protein OmpA-like peptidoglycan-associated protein